MAENLWEIRFGHRPYRLELVELRDSEAFWAICGSKKGSQHCGGGIPIPGLKPLYGICNLIEQIALLDDKAGKTETKVNFFSFRNRIFCGETRIFMGQPFYRIKGYSNYFLKNGDIYFYKQHQLKPTGRGFFIQEFDFPISPTGVEEAKNFSGKIREIIEQHLKKLVGQLEGDTIDLIRKEQVLVGGGPPWVNSDTSLETVVLHKSLFDFLCDKLREEPLTPNRLAINLGLTPDTGNNLLNPASRYDPRFFERGFLLDRVREGFDSLHYLITQIPLESLEESPTLTHLFEEETLGKWPDWISATFSNDDYSTGRKQSFHFAEFEIEAFEGGMEWGITPESSQLRSSAIRLFDLRRHFRRDTSMTEKIDTLVERFIEINKETGHV
jgi:hypothetical protein